MGMAYDDVFKPVHNCWGHEGPQKPPRNSSEDGDDDDDDGDDYYGNTWRYNNHQPDDSGSGSAESNDKQSADKVSGKEDNTGQDADNESEVASLISFNSNKMEDPGPPERLIPTVDKPEASLPAAQFLNQLAAERDWLLDKAIYENPGAPVPMDLDERARESVRDNWMWDGIWNHAWDEAGVPFGRWPHEHPRKEDLPTAEEKKHRVPLQQLGTIGLEEARRLRWTGVEPDASTAVPEQAQEAVPHGREAGSEKLSEAETASDGKQPDLSAHAADAPSPKRRRLSDGELSGPEASKNKSTATVTSHHDQPAKEKKKVRKTAASAMVGAPRRSTRIAAKKAASSAGK
jgi:hypothetical protein